MPKPRKKCINLKKKKRSEAHQQYMKARSTAYYAMFELYDCCEKLDIHIDNELEEIMTEIYES